MANEKEGLPPQATQPNRCPKCSAPLRLMHKFLDPRSGKTIRVAVNASGENKAAPV